MFDDVMKQLGRLNRYSIYSGGLCRVYEGDGNTDGSGGGGTGDDDKEEKKEEKPSGAASDENISGYVKGLPDSKVRELLGDRSFTVTVDGQSKDITLAEALKDAEKVGGADAKFRTAAEQVKQAERGIKAMELFDRLATDDGKPNEADLSELAGLLKIDGSDLMKLMDIEEAGDKGSRGKKGKAEDVVGFDKLSPELQEVVKAAREAQWDETVKIVKGDCKKAIDKDEILSKIVDRAEEGKKSEVQQTLIDIVFEDVQRKILAREEYGADMVKNSVQRARAVVNKLGIPSKTSRHPVLGPGPSGQLPAEVYSDDTIKRVSSTEAGYEQNAVNRVLQSFVKQSKS